VPAAAHDLKKRFESVPDGSTEEALGKGDRWRGSGKSRETGSIRMLHRSLPIANADGKKGEKKNPCDLFSGREGRPEKGKQTSFEQRNEEEP